MGVFDTFILELRTYSTLVYSAQFRQTLYTRLPEMADSELQTLLVQHKKYFTTQADGKIHCSLNNHCFPARLDVIGAFVKWVNDQLFDMWDRLTHVPDICFSLIHCCFKLSLPVT